MELTKEDRKLIEEAKKNIEEELFKAFSGEPTFLTDPEGAKALYMAKPLSREDLEEFKKAWMDAVNKPQSFEIIHAKK